MSDPLLETILVNARALVGAITKDEAGEMVAGQWVGGGGGLLSRDTLKAADALRLAIDAHGRARAKLAIGGDHG